MNRFKTKFKNSFSREAFKANSKIPLIISIIVGIILGSLILLIMGMDPFALLRKIFAKSFSNNRNFIRFLEEFGLFMLLGLSAMFSLKVGFFNIGAPGQMVFAGMCASLFASNTHLPAALSVLLTTLIAILAATAMTLIAGLLKIYFGISDIVSTVLLNWIALYLLQYVYFHTTGFSPTAAYTDVKTPDVPGNSDWIISGVVSNTTFSITIFVAILVMVIAYLIFTRTRLGHKINVVGKNERAGYIGGYNTKKVAIISILISGIIIGLFSMGWYLGKNQSMVEIATSMPPAMGFNGLILFVMSGGSVQGMAFAAFLLDILQGPGSENLIGVPANTSQIFAATIIYCVAVIKLFEHWWDIKGYFDRKKVLLQRIRTSKIILKIKSPKVNFKKGGQHGNI